MTGLGHLPFKERTVETPTGRQYVGVDFAKQLCGVSIIRSGESMENALRACCKGIKIGKILVHRCACCLFPVLHLHADSRARGQYKWWPCCGFIERHDDQFAKTSDISRVGCNSYYRVGDAAMEQALVYEKLPRDIAERHVLLLDPMLGCGSSAVKAIEVWHECGHTPHLPPLLPCSCVQEHVCMQMHVAPCAVAGHVLVLHERCFSRRGWRRARSSS